MPRQSKSKANRRTAPRRQVFDPPPVTLTHWNSFNIQFQAQHDGTTIVYWTATDVGNIIAREVYGNLIPIERLDFKISAIRAWNMTGGLNPSHRMQVTDWIVPYDFNESSAFEKFRIIFDKLDTGTKEHPSYTAYRSSGNNRKTVLSGANGTPTLFEIIPRHEGALSMLFQIRGSCRVNEEHEQPARISFLELEALAKQDSCGQSVMLPPARPCCVETEV